MKSLKPGLMLDDSKYAVVGKQRNTPLGSIYRAIEQEHGNPVSILDIAQPLVSEQSFQAISTSIKKLKSIRSKQLVHSQTILAHENRQLLVTDFIEGQTLKDWTELRRAKGTISIKATINILTHLCVAMESLKDISPHLLATPDTVVINAAGRVKLCFTGLSALAPAILKLESCKGFIDPAVADGIVDNKSDFFNLGAILYFIVTGNVPARGCPRPSQVNDNLSSLADTFVATCMHPKRSERPETFTVTRQAIKKALITRSDTDSEPRVRAPTGEFSSKAVMNSAADRRPPTIDHSEKWLVTRGNLDYGPFTFAALLKQIDTNELLPGHVIMDNETGERSKVEEHPLLSQRVMDAKLRRDDQRRAEFETDNVKQDKKRNIWTIAIIVGLLSVLAVGAYFLVSKLSEDKSDDVVAIEGLDGNKVNVTISFPKAPSKKSGPKSKRNGKSKKNGSSSSSSSSDGWDDSLSFDMSKGGGGSEKLDSSQINPVLNKKIGKMGRCLIKNGGGKAAVDFIILGTGKVSQVRVNKSTSSGLSNCIKGIMKSMSFPTFNGPRTKGNFEISLWAISDKR